MERRFSGAIGGLGGFGGMSALDGERELRNGEFIGSIDCGTT
jgi:glycerol kinase